MDLTSLLLAHSYLTVEQPPSLWLAEAEDEPLIRLLGEMIAAALTGGSDLTAITLRANNVVIDTGEGPTTDGEYVTLSILAGGDWATPSHWWLSGSDVLVNGDLDRAARAASVRYAYTQTEAGVSSVTIFLSRLIAPTSISGDEHLRQG